IAGAKTAIEAEIRDHTRQNEKLRVEAESLQRDLAGLQSQLAVLEERRSAVSRELTVLRDQEISLSSRAQDADSQIQEAREQQEQARATIESLDLTRAKLADEHGRLAADIEEYQEAEQRFQCLTAQRQDLLDSIRDTTQAIEEIDSVCRRQFKEAFESVNAGFQQSFVSLFGGGHGELRLLENAEDGERRQDDAGVEIVAQPPGKKLQNVLLLSGGEKA